MESIDQPPYPRRPIMPHLDTGHSPEWRAEEPEEEEGDEMTTQMPPVRVNGAPIEYDRCPEIAREIMRRYIEQGIDPGSGYRTILCEDLRAVLMVDDKTLAELPAILRWLYNYAPSNCRGSRVTVDEWMFRRRLAA